MTYLLIGKKQQQQQQQQNPCIVYNVSCDLHANCNKIGNTNNIAYILEASENKW